MFLAVGVRVEIPRFFRPVLLSLVIVSSMCGIGVAAELSRGDYDYLASEYGLRKGHALFDRLTSMSRRTFMPSSPPRS
jgi:hypothetical protein